MNNFLLFKFNLLFDILLYKIGILLLLYQLENFTYLIIDFIDYKNY